MRPIGRNRIMSILPAVIQTETWRAALEKYGAATGMTVAVYQTSDVPIVGPVYPTPLFEVVSRRRDPVMFRDCAERCLAQTDTPMIIDDNGVAVLGVRLVVAGEAVGAVVAGYGVTVFPEEATVRRFTLRHALPLTPVWRAIRRQAPLTKPRLDVYTGLLAALTETLLSENVRSQEHERAAARLAEALRSKDQFLAMLAHELRNPLAPIRIAMQIIDKGEATNPDVHKARQIVDRQVGHLTRLLDDLFDVSRVTSGKVELRREAVNLATAVANALEATRDVIQQRNHLLSVSLPEEPVFVDGDPLRLEQVITNLLNNAARYTPPNGHVHVSASRHDGYAELRVRDDGVGIPAHVLPRIFDLFAQADESLARSEGGLGIGLTIVRSLVELHGGAVTVRSDGPGQGSEFTVRVPLGKSGPSRPEPPVKNRAVLPRLRVLVIEDNADSRDILRTMLEIDGHQVEIAVDGPAGVEVARAIRPEVAVIDIGLPGLDGYQVARRIRDDLGPAVRLVALTGYGQPDDRRRSAQAGFDDHLVKPVTPEQIREALGRRFTSAA